MKIRISPADKVFSHYIRLRDKRCVRCNSRVRVNDEGLPISHTASHYFGRGNETTRFDPENCDCLCMGCHEVWASKDREDYREFKIKQLGQQGFDLLLLKSKLCGKKDRAMALIIATELLKEIRSIRGNEYDCIQG